MGECTVHCCGKTNPPPKKKKPKLKNEYKIVPLIVAINCTDKKQKQTKSRDVSFSEFLKLFTKCEPNLFCHVTDAMSNSRPVIAQISAEDLCSSLSPPPLCSYLRGFRAPSPFAL